MTSKNISGFTLVELMITVAIVGILAAIAVPAYSDYIKRSQVSEALIYMDASKTNVSEAYMTNGLMPATNADAGMLPAAQIQSKYVNGITITNGTITATVSINGVGTAGSGSTPGAGNLLVMTPTPNSAGIIWYCGNTAATTVDHRYLPSSCR
jgi:type IV pilus assembly protein PilA